MDVTKTQYWKKGLLMSQIDHAIHIKTVFCDIDGCIFKHHGDMMEIVSNPCEVLLGVRDMFKKWAHKGYTIVLTTGRPENRRAFTEQQIHEAGLFYSHLIMGLPRGPRVVINDVKPSKNIKMAACVNLERNKGMENVDI